uniref:Uncharacterized protein n=1 Tax=uncultured marine virus TaxID=186617 RepID=A0A0F7L9Z9_9VIRU|nr:hypothetical protein [uncultured marine virus]
MRCGRCGGPRDDARDQARHLRRLSAERERRTGSARPRAQAWDSACVSSQSWEDEGTRAGYVADDAMAARKGGE